VSGTGKTATAHHDLNNVTELRICGWAGRHVVVRADDSHWVTIEAPERHEGEFWTFGRQQRGVLTCFTSLLGSPSLLGETDDVMTIRLPAYRIGAVAVTFETP
jgi:hypothetical protein